jgi:peptidyl-prolyl cis-trans isomerase C
MRRFFPLVVTPLFVTVTALAIPACSKKAPAPEKAEEAADDKGKKGDEDGAAAKSAKKKEAKELPALPTGTMAVVNGVEIPMTAFDAVYGLKLKKYTDSGRPIPKTTDRRYRQSIAERLIYQEVLRQETKAQGVEFDPAELETRLARQKEGIKDWERHLKNRGESEESVKEMIIRELREEALLRKAGKLEVTEAEIDAEYEKRKPTYRSDHERIQASHILIPVGTGGPLPGDTSGTAEPDEATKAQWEKEALAKANEAYKLATASGADFAAVAKTHSVGPSAAKGGDLGIFTSDRMIREFSDVAFKLKINEVSKPVRTKFGFHVIKVLAKYPPGDLPKAALAGQIRTSLETRKLLDGRRELKEEVLARFDVDDRILKSLGEEPPVKWGTRNDHDHGHDDNAAAPAGTPAGEKKEEPAKDEKAGDKH